MFIECMTKQVGPLPLQDHPLENTMKTSPLSVFMLAVQVDGGFHSFCPDRKVQQVLFFNMYLNIDSTTRIRKPAV